MRFTKALEFILGIFTFLSGISLTTICLFNIGVESTPETVTVLISVAGMLLTGIGVFILIGVIFRDDEEQQMPVLKEECENMQGVIFGLEEDKRQLQEQVDELKRKALFYYERCKSYGIECFCDETLEKYGVEVE